MEETIIYHRKFLSTFFINFLLKSNPNYFKTNSNPNSIPNLNHKKVNEKCEEIPYFRFILFNLEVFGEIVIPDLK